jgi:hypothetical protein
MDYASGAPFKDEVVRTSKKHRRPKGDARIDCHRENASHHRSRSVTVSASWRRPCTSASLLVGVTRSRLSCAQVALPWLPGDAGLRPFWAANLTGAGEVVGCGDSGINWGHCMLADPNNPLSLSNFTARSFDSYSPAHNTACSTNSGGTVHTHFGSDVARVTVGHRAGNPRRAAS